MREVRTGLDIIRRSVEAPLLRRVADVMNWGSYLGARVTGDVAGKPWDLLEFRLREKAAKIDANPSMAAHYRMAQEETMKDIERGKR